MSQPVLGPATLVCHKPGNDKQQRDLIIAEGLIMTDRAALSKFVCEQNIERYERMLRTPLTELEREFVQRRVAEEQRALQALTSGGNAARRIASRILGVALLPDLVDSVISSSCDLAQVCLI